MIYLRLLVVTLFFALPFMVFAKEKTSSLQKKMLPEKRILLIGDSHSVGIFGHSLTNLLEENLANTQITTVASCGSDTRWWLEGKTTACGFWKHSSPQNNEESLTGRTPKLDELLKKVKPKTTLVALGSNLALMENTERQSYTEKMLEMLKARGGRCVWISAPDSRRLSKKDIGHVYDELKKLTKKYSCKLVDSRKYTKYPAIGGDGLHYGGKEGAAIAHDWATNVFYKEIKPLLSTPLKSLPKQKG